MITHDRGGRVLAGNLRMACSSWSGDGPTIVALHGITASSASYVGIAERLAGRRPLLALDLRGRGDTDKPAGPYGMETHAADVAAAMASLDLGPSIVVGHSMGGFVAAALAANHPEMVAGVVFIDGGLPLDPPEGVSVEQLLDMVLAMQVGRLRQTFGSEDEYFDFWRSQPTFAGERWNRWVEHYLRYDLGPAGDGFRPKASEAAVRADSLDTADRDAMRRRLKSIQVPVRMLRAAEGFNPGDPPLFPDDLVAREGAAVADFDESVVAGSTHYTIALGEEPAGQVADAIIAYAERRGR